MKIDIKATHIELTDAILGYVEEKLGVLDHFFGEEVPEHVSINVEIGKSSQHHHSGPFFYAEANLHLAGEVFRATADHEDLYAAVDVVKDELSEQIRRFKDKQISKRRETVEA